MMSDNKRRRRLKSWLLVVAFIVLLVGTYAGSFFTTTNEKIEKYKAAKAQLPIVKVEAASLTSWNDAYELPGSIVGFSEVTVASEVGGTVKRILFKDNESVAASTVLVELDADYEKANLSARMAELDLATTTQQRVAAQLLRNATSKAELDRAVAEAKSLEAQVSASQELLERKKIRAPIEGRTGIRKVNIGDYVLAGQKVVTIQDLKSAYVDFYVPQKLLPLIQSAQQLIVTCDAYPDMAFRGSVHAIEPRIDKSIRSLMVRGYIPKAEGKLLPGMYARVKVVSPQVRRSVQVPRTSLDFGGGNAKLYAVDKDLGEQRYSVVPVSVEVGEVQGDMAEILSGIADGQLIVSEGHIKLRGTSEVIAVNDSAAVPVQLTSAESGT